MFSLNCSTLPPVPLKAAVSPPYFTSCTLMCVAAARGTHTPSSLLMILLLVAFFEGEVQDHGTVVGDFVALCDMSFLHRNVSEMKHMKSPPSQLPTVRQGLDIDLVDSNKCLESHTDAASKKVIFREK